MGSFKFSNREYLAPIYTQAGGTHAANWLMNPRKIPWLSQVAAAFDLYRFEALTVEYVPSCPTTTPGQLVLFFDYDPTDDNAALTLPQASQNTGAVATQLFAPCRTSYKAGNSVVPVHKYFCSSSSSPDRLNDCARLWIFTDSTAAVSAGGVYLSYTVSLFNPEISTNIVGGSVLYKPATGAAQPYIDNGHPISTVANIKTVANVVGAGLNLSRNVTQAANFVAEVVDHLTMAAGCEPYQQPIEVHIVGDHPGSQVTPVADSLSTMATVGLADTPWYQYKGGASDIWTMIQLNGTWTATGGGTDRPHLTMYLAGGWYIQEYWSSVSPDTYVTATPTLCYMAAILHFRRSTVHPTGPELAFAITVDGGGNYTSPGVDASIMACPAPYLDDVPLEYY